MNVLTVGRGGLLSNDLTDGTGLGGGATLGVFSVGVMDVTGLAGCERL